MNRRDKNEISFFTQFPNFATSQFRNSAISSSRVAGIDEAGRGPLAGPVVAGAVECGGGVLAADIVLGSAGRLAPPEFNTPPEFNGLTDSKKLSEAQRERFYEILTTHPDIRWAVGFCSPAEIDELNILRATHLAMARAAAALPGGLPDHALIDGLPVKNFPIPHTAIVKGDSKVLLISAASVIAKVTRDRIMLELDREYPGYGFAKHKSYPVPEHIGALRKLGVSPVHRKSFKPVR
ncbi:MAG: ribonuclease HII, partial [Kiritimatiellaeota bacterium]|nr:ribonuclease HII [Kiritimatiellota bacterium]